MRTPSTLFLAFSIITTTSMVSAQTFTAFPSTLSCPLISGAAATFTVAELESIASAGVKEEPFEKSAANISSWRCQKLKLPFYSSHLGKGAGQLYFVYDSQTDNIEFCGATTPSLDPAGGYPENCVW